MSLSFCKKKMINQNSLRNISDNPIFTKFSQIFIRFCHFSFAANLTAKLRQLWPQRQNKLFKRFALKQRTQEKSKQALSLWLLTCVGIICTYACVCVCLKRFLTHLQRLRIHSWIVWRARNHGNKFMLNFKADRRLAYVYSPIM